MQPMDFALRAFRILGARVTEHEEPGLFSVEENGGRQVVRFQESVRAHKSTYLAPGTPEFARLVDRVIATGVHEVEDMDANPADEALAIAAKWATSVGGQPKKGLFEKVSRCFAGNAVLRVRATVAHDSYERLVDVFCLRGQHIVADSAKKGMEKLPHSIQSLAVAGVDVEKLVDRAKQDEAISEFCRFYLERREQEMEGARDDARKRKKLEEEFTPRLEMTLVALQGRSNRQVQVKQLYSIDAAIYENVITVEPLTNAVLDPPEMGRCAESGKNVPVTCLDRCQISGALVQRHLLVRSELSDRVAQRHFTVVCNLSGKRLLRDEAETSVISGRPVQSSLLKTSVVSGKKAEPSEFGACEFTRSQVLKSELATSKLSGKSYRVDEERRSSVSGLTGHPSEFVVCQVTGQFLALGEAEQCEMTGNYVRPGILLDCEITKKRVLPSQLSRCAATGKRVLPSLLVSSSITGAQLREAVAIRSSTGEYCAPLETKTCVWSGTGFHPTDLRICRLSGLLVHFRYVVGESDLRLQPLIELLDGIRRNRDEIGSWERAAQKIALSLGRGKCCIEAGMLSPDGNRLAVCATVKTILGFRTRQAGAIFEIKEESIVGRVAYGRRTPAGWQVEQVETA